MLTVKFVLGNDVLEEAIKKANNRIDYYEKAMTLLYTGTEFQQIYINYIMENYTGKRRTRELKCFIDNLMMMGEVEA